MKTVLMFGGQGSQYYQMGRALYAEDADFRSLMDDFDARLAACTGHRVLPEVFGTHSPSVPFFKLRHTHHALLVLQCSLAELVLQWGAEPVAMLGCSAGELHAAVVAGVYSFEDGVRALQAQVEMLEEGCPEGAMVAVLADEDDVMPMVRAHGLCLAGVNGPGNCVVAGPLPAVRSFEEELRRLSIVTMALPVEYAFHSREIDCLEEAYRSFCRTLPTRRPRWPILAASRADSMYEWAPEQPWCAIRKPIRLADTVQLIPRDAGLTYLDVSPSGTLAALLARTLPAHRRRDAVGLLNPYGSSTARANGVRQRLAGTCLESAHV